MWFPTNPKISFRLSAKPRAETTYIELGLCVIWHSTLLTILLLTYQLMAADPGRGGLVTGDVRNSIHSRVRRPSCFLLFFTTAIYSYALHTPQQLSSDGKFVSYDVQRCVWSKHLARTGIAARASSQFGRTATAGTRAN